MKYYFSGEEIRAVPEVVLPNACIMLSFYYIRVGTSRKRFNTVLRSRKKERKEKK